VSEHKLIELNEGQTKRVRPSAYRWVITLAAFALAVAIYLGVSVNPNAIEATNLATTRQPEHYTELYFNNVQYLPRATKPRQLASFSYHVKNHEATEKSYTAIVTLTENGTTRILERNEFKLQSSGYENVSVRYITPLKKTNFTITVSLPELGQNIHFRSYM
jgi:hypothetical protein